MFFEAQIHLAYFNVMLLHDLRCWFLNIFFKMDCAIGSMDKRAIHTLRLCISPNEQKHIWSKLCPQAPVWILLTTPKADGASLSRSLQKRESQGLDYGPGEREPIVSSLSIRDEGLQTKGYFSFCEISCCDYGIRSWLQHGFKFLFQVAAENDQMPLYNLPQHPQVPLQQHQISSFSSSERIYYLPQWLSNLCMEIKSSFLEKAVMLRQDRQLGVLSCSFIVKLCKTGCLGGTNSSNSKDYSDCCFHSYCSVLLKQSYSKDLKCDGAFSFSSFSL